MSQSSEQYPHDDCSKRYKPYDERPRKWTLKIPPLTLKPLHLFIHTPTSVIGTTETLEKIKWSPVCEYNSLKLVATNSMRKDEVIPSLLQRPPSRSRPCEEPRVVFDTSFKLEYGMLSPLSHSVTHRPSRDRLHQLQHRCKPDVGE